MSEVPLTCRSCRNLASCGFSGGEGSLMTCGGISAIISTLRLEGRSVSVFFIQEDREQNRPASVFSNSENARKRTVPVSCRLRERMNSVGVQSGTRNLRSSWFLGGLAVCSHAVKLVSRSNFARCRRGDDGTLKCAPTKSPSTSIILTAALRGVLHQIIYPEARDFLETPTRWPHTCRYQPTLYLGC